MKIIICLLFAAGLAPATTLDFTWTGQRYMGSQQRNANADGSITFADGLVDVSLQSITGFSMQVTETIPPQYAGNPLPITTTQVLGLSDLTTFSMILGPGNIPTYADFFAGAFTVHTDTGGTIYAVTTDNAEGWMHFTDPPSPVPECGALAMLGIGLTLLGSRRFLTRKPAA